MQNNNTVAILGAGSAIGQFIAEKIAGNYPLLLMDNSAETLNRLTELLTGKFATPQIEMIVCSKEA